MTILQLEDVTVCKGRRPIVDAVSLELAGGALVAVIGPNGAGKSTMLTVLAGPSRPDRGHASLDGTPVLRLDRRALARRRAYLPQNPTAEWPIPVERLVAFGLIPQLPAFGSLPDALNSSLTRALARFDLLDNRQQPATTLSGGELARAMLARALVGDPDVLIVDEPFAGLDPRHTLDGIRALRDLADCGKLSSLRSTT